MLERMLDNEILWKYKKMSELYRVKFISKLNSDEIVRFHEILIRYALQNLDEEE